MALRIVGDVAAAYENIEFFGSGAEANVYSATYVPTKERVAIKVLRPSYTGESSKKRQIERFVREAAVLRRISHPHVARVYEILDVMLDEVPTKAFIMEWLPKHLRQTYDGKPEGLRLEELETYFKQALSGLAYLHGHGVAVRDLRPENLLLSEQGELKIADLGMARTEDSAASLVESSRYVAPEILDGSIREAATQDPPADSYFASDIYSLGFIFFEASIGVERWESLPVLDSVYSRREGAPLLDLNQRWREWHMNRELVLPSVKTLRIDLFDWICAALDAMVCKDVAKRRANVQGVFAAFHRRDPVVPQSRSEQSSLKRKPRRHRRVVAWRPKPRWMLPVAAAAAAAVVVFVRPVPPALTPASAESGVEPGAKKQQEVALGTPPDAKQSSATSPAATGHEVETKAKVAPHPKRAPKVPPAGPRPASARAPQHRAGPTINNRAGASRPKSPANSRKTQQRSSPSPVPETRFAGSTSVPQGSASTPSEGWTESTPPPPPPPPPPSKEPSFVVIPAGVTLIGTLRRTVSSETAQRGTGVTLIIESSVSNGGAVLVPARSILHGTVTVARAAGRYKGGAELEVLFTTLAFPDGRSAAVTCTPVHRTTKGSGRESVAEIGAGAVIGGAIGWLTGGRDGLQKGALAGGVAGAGVAGATDGTDVVIEAGTSLRVTLQESVRVLASN